VGSQYTRAVRQVHSLFIESNELTDHTENPLKFIGDIYAAQLFSLVADRLGLETWKANVQEKLKTLDDILVVLCPWRLASTQSREGPRATQGNPRTKDAKDQGQTKAHGRRTKDL